MSTHKETRDLSFPISRGADLVRRVSNELGWAVTVHSATSFTLAKPLTLFGPWPVGVNITLETASAGITRFDILCYGGGLLDPFGALAKQVKDLWATIELCAVAVLDQEPVLCTTRP